MDLERAAKGGPLLRDAWEQCHVRPVDLAGAIGVTPRALSMWSAVGGKTPPKRVGDLAHQLHEAAGHRERERQEVLALITGAAAAGRGLTRTELRKARRAGDTDELLEELRAGALPLAHVRPVDARDEQGRTYVREELHPGAGAAPEPVDEGDDVDDLDPATLRGLRLYAGRSTEGMASRYDCRRQQLQAWETGREQMPLGRRAHVRQKLTAAIEQPRRAPQDRARVLGWSHATLAAETGIAAPVLSRGWSGKGRPLRWRELATIGRVLDQAERAAAAKLAADVDELVALVAAAEPHGLTEAQLERARSRGRVRGQTGAPAHDQFVLDTALGRRRVQWLSSPDALGRGNARRLHTGDHRPATLEVLDPGELRRLLDDAGISASELGRAIGVNFGSVARWLRGERRIPPSNTVAIRTALAELTARPRRDPAAELLAAAHATPGLPPWRLLQQAGYGKANTAAAAALEQLRAAGQVHLEPRPNHSRVVVPGPAHDVPTRMAGDELRRRRREAGLRQRDLAAAAGVNQTAVAGWERAGLPAERRASIEGLLRTPPRDPSRPYQPRVTVYRPQGDGLAARWTV